VAIQKLLLFEVPFYVRIWEEMDTLQNPLITDRKFVKNSVVDKDIFNTPLTLPWVDGIYTPNPSQDGN